MSNLLILSFFQTKGLKVSVSIKQIRKQFLHHAVGPIENEHRFPQLYIS